MKRLLVTLLLLSQNYCTQAAEPSHSTCYEDEALQIEGLEYEPSQKINHITSLIFIGALLVVLYDSCEISKDGVLFVPVSGVLKFTGRVCNGASKLIRSLGKL